MEHPKRKQNRLKTFDYHACGAYFITICTHDRAPLFWSADAETAIRSRMDAFQPVGAMAMRDLTRNGTSATKRSEVDRIRPFLSEKGKIVDRAISDIPVRYPKTVLDHYVIMPNHIHILLRICETSGRSVSDIIGQTKRRISKELGKSIWQKSFYDHIVRDEEDWRRIWTYIENNPAHWEQDCFYTEI
jgi:REP element-mobilizing transposase RayT